MNTNRIYAGIAAATATIALAGGVFFATNGSDQADGATAPQPQAVAQSITALARDTSKKPLSSVAVRIVDSTNTTVARGTTTSTGQISLDFNPSAGTYLVIADQPTGYFARDDKDGGAVDVNGPNCDNVYLCISLTATETTNADGSTSVSVQLTHVRPEQVSELDDLWFELTPPTEVVEEDSSIDVDDVDDVLIGDSDDVLIGDSDDVLIGDPDDELIDGPDDVLIGDPDDVLIDGPDAEPVPDSFEATPVPEPGLRQICPSARHQMVPSQNTASGIWVRGEVYGLDGGWIFVEGPTFNNGQPLQIPVQSGAFNAPLGINQFGDHEVTRFELGGDDVAPVDLLPTLATGPGIIFPVDADEGPLFDTECFDFDPPADAGSPQPEPVDVPAAGDVTAQEQAAATALVDDFFESFVENHRNADSAALLDTLHPSVPLAFGEDVCTQYVTSTTGSIGAATTTSVGFPTTHEMDTPGGTITFPEAIPFTVEFTLRDGSTVSNDAHLALHDGNPNWLTTCGVDN